MGVRFQIFLPLVEQGLEQDKVSLEENPTDISFQKELKVLLVEDDALFQEWLVRFLRKEGALVSTAANGQEAIDRLNTGEVDVIISDFKMPEMNGLEFCQWIAKERPDDLKRFFFLTGITETALNDFCKEKNIPILMKPIKKTRLLKTLGQVHGQKTDCC